jgi:hypothetical protein
MSATSAASGLYSFKPWYAGLLTPVSRRLAAAHLCTCAISAPLVAGCLRAGGDLVNGAIKAGVAACT